MPTDSTLPDLDLTSLGTMAQVVSGGAILGHGSGVVVVSRAA